MAEEKCVIHGDLDANQVPNKIPDTDCTCEGVGGSERGEGQGPATDPELIAKRKEPILNPHPIATGPAADPELLGVPTGPAKGNDCN